MPLRMSFSRHDGPSVHTTLVLNWYEEPAGALALPTSSADVDRFMLVFSAAGILRFVGLAKLPLVAETCSSWREQWWLKRESCEGYTGTGGEGRWDTATGPSNRPAAVGPAAPGNSAQATDGFGGGR
jgi:hypothetical protein